MAPIEIGVSRSKVTVTLSVKSFPVNNLSTDSPIGLILPICIGLGPQMTPIEIGCTRSKVKVTVTINVKIVSDE